MDEKDSRFDEQPDKASTPSPLRASNTLESLRPREILAVSGDGAIRTEDLVTGARTENGYSVQQFTPFPETHPNYPTNREVAPVKYTRPEQGSANVLPVNWPASSNKPPKSILLPSVYDRVTKLEEQLDALLDRIALHNVRSSHKL